MPCTDKPRFDVHELAELNALAADVIRRAVAACTRSVPAGNDGRYIAPAACFVTLKQQGRLRACIGTLAAHRALRDDVAANALAAALRDPRFAPLTAHELPLTEVEVSVLSAPSLLRFANAPDLFAQLRPGVDGLIVEHQGRSASYLPSVWEQLPERGLFVQELRRKAGIESSVALTAVRVRRYTTQHSAPCLLLIN